MGNLTLSTEVPNAASLSTSEQQFRRILVIFLILKYFRAFREKIKCPVKAGLGEHTSLVSSQHVNIEKPEITGIDKVGTQWYSFIPENYIFRSLYT